MDNNLNQSVLDKLTKTCTCKLITRAKIKEAINGLKYDIICRKTDIAAYTRRIFF